MATILFSAAGAAVGGSIGGTVAGLSSVAIGRAVGATPLTILRFSESPLQGSIVFCEFSPQGSVAA